MKNNARAKVQRMSTAIKLPALLTTFDKLISLGMKEEDALLTCRSAYDEVKSGSIPAERMAMYLLDDSVDMIPDPDYEDE